MLTLSDYCTGACVAYMNKTELETLPELEQKMNLAKRHLFLLFDFATLSPQEIRLNSSTFTWSGHIFDVLHECKQIVEVKMKQFQESLRMRRERLIEDLESFAQQVRMMSHDQHVADFCFKTLLLGNRLHVFHRLLY